MKCFFECKSNHNGYLSNSTIDASGYLPREGGATEPGVSQSARRSLKLIKAIIMRPKQAQGKVRHGRSLIAREAWSSFERGTGTPVQAPVGKGTLARMFDVFGHPNDRQGDRNAAMQRADKNIVDPLETLNHTFNSLRQSRIDEDLSRWFPGLKRSQGNAVTLQWVESGVLTLFTTHNKQQS
jgi:hypothetical protein